MSSLWKFITGMPGISGEVILLVVIVSIIAFIAYGADKMKAIKGRYRTPEITLLALALFGGAFGAFLGMCLFRHKTKHWYFWVVNWAGFVLLAVAFWYFGLRDL